MLDLGKLKIDFKGNYTFQQNKVTKVYEGLDQLSIGNGGLVVVKKGEPAYLLNLLDYNRDPQGRVIVDARLWHLLRVFARGAPGRRAAKNPELKRSRIS